MSTLDSSIKSALLRMARDAISAELFGTPATRAEDDRLANLPSAGVFVTLRKNGHLRGCIGTFDESHNLAETVRTMAVAAMKDPRFVHVPIGANELGEIDIEISVLSPLERIRDPLDFQLGSHGIFVRNGSLSGCFLPDVATERGWTRESFLSECCTQKAGLDPLAWRSPSTEVYTFTVDKITDRAR